jgi:hypothetical protein
MMDGVWMRIDVVRAGPQGYGGEQAESHVG